jgi:hypothetical protein
MVNQYVEYAEKRRGDWMVNFGWGKMPAAEQRELVRRLKAELKLPEGYTGDGKPYIEQDGLYQGVRLRKLTNLSDEELELLTVKADKIYSEVMGMSTEKHEKFMRDYAKEHGEVI